MLFGVIATCLHLFAVSVPCSHIKVLIGSLDELVIEVTVTSCLWLCSYCCLWLLFVVVVVQLLFVAIVVVVQLLFVVVEWLQG